MRVVAKLLVLLTTLCAEKLLLFHFLQSYFKDSWNTFDFVTVVGSIVDALMVEFAVSTIFLIPALSFKCPKNINIKCTKLAKSTKNVSRPEKNLFVVSDNKTVIHRRFSLLWQFWELFWWSSFRTRFRCCDFFHSLQIFAHLNRVYPIASMILIFVSPCECAATDAWPTFWTIGNEAKLTLHPWCFHRERRA